MSSLSELLFDLPTNAGDWFTIETDSVMCESDEEDESVAIATSLQKLLNPSQGQKRSGGVKKVGPG